MQDILFENITIEKVTLGSENTPVDVLRLDKMHPLISGNKWFKLTKYLDEAILTSKMTIVTYGGPWSNHLAATAAACRQHNLHAIGIVRGERPAALSLTLETCEKSGMKLFFVSRENYKSKYLPDSVDLQHAYIIPEGGYGKLGMEGAALIADLFEEKNYTHICISTGTGTTIAGLVLAVGGSCKVVGISALKNNLDLSENIKHLTGTDILQTEIFHDYSFGGYAKSDPLLIRFMNEFYNRFAIPTDFVYTGKLFYAVNDLLNKKWFPADSRILVIHTGGLQGNASLKKGTLIF